LPQYKPQNTGSRADNEIRKLADIINRLESTESRTIVIGGSGGGSGGASKSDYKIKSFSYSDFPSEITVASIVNKRLWKAYLIVYTAFNSGSMSILAGSTTVIPSAEIDLQAQYPLEIPIFKKYINSTDIKINLTGTPTQGSAEIVLEIVEG
jgi:hypothetical protein